MTSSVNGCAKTSRTTQLGDEGGGGIKTIFAYHGDDDVGDGDDDVGDGEDDIDEDGNDNVCDSDGGNVRNCGIEADADIFFSRCEAK